MSCLVTTALNLYQQGLQIQNISENEFSVNVLVSQLVKLDIIVTTGKSHPPQIDGIN